MFEGQMGGRGASGQGNSRTGKQESSGGWLGGRAEVEQVTSGGQSGSRKTFNRELRQVEDEHEASLMGRADLQGNQDADDACRAALEDQETWPQMDLLNYCIYTCNIMKKGAALCLLSLFLWSC